MHHKAAILRPVLAASRLASKRFAAHWLGRADEAAVQARVQGSVVDGSLPESGKHVDTAGGESELEPQCLCPNDRLHFCSLLVPTLVEKNWKELSPSVHFFVQQQGRAGNVKESSLLRSALKQTVPEKVAASFALNPLPLHLRPAPIRRRHFAPAQEARGSGALACEAAARPPEENH